ncbi:MAG: hypothetical protein ACLSGK_14040 [Lachnospiraceae bacterium]
MCSGAMVWVKLGRLVYGASNTDLEHILGNAGCNCSGMVFKNSFWKPQVTSGVLREESLAVLKEYFEKHEKMKGDEKYIRRLSLKIRYREIC